MITTASILALSVQEPMFNRQGCDQHILGRFPSRMVKIEKECLMQLFYPRADVAIQGTTG